MIKYHVRRRDIRAATALRIEEMTKARNKVAATLREATEGYEAYRGMDLDALCRAIKEAAATALNPGAEVNRLISAVHAHTAIQVHIDRMQLTQDFIEGESPDSTVSLELRELEKFFLPYTDDTRSARAQIPMGADTFLAR